MHTQYKILCVDDESANLRLLERLFRDSYDVITASGGVEALALLEVHDCAVIISDQRMPGMSGIEFLKRAADLRRQTVRIMLTGYTDAGTLVEAINSGVVYKYITKPWVNDDLTATVKRALQHYETSKAQRQLQLQNERLQSRLKALRDSLIDMVSGMLDLKDPLSREHARRTSEYSRAIGTALGMGRAELEQLGLAAFLKEAALFRVPTGLLAKDGEFSDDEFSVISRNFESGLTAFRMVPDLEEVASVLSYYFERFDGSGRRHGFAGEQIPLHARIIAVADAFDTLTSPRTIRLAFTKEEALQHLSAKAGTQFDPAVVNALCSINGFAVTPVPEFELIEA